MKYVRQFLIILMITFLGEVIKGLIPLPVPASIYGLLIMLVALMTGILPLKAVEDVGTFFVEIMPLTFIPAGVGLLQSWDVLQPMWISVVVITVVSTIVVMVVTGLVTQAVIRLKRNRDAEKM